MRVGIIAAMLIASAAGLGLWLYRGAVEREIADIKSRLVSEAQLADRHGRRASNWVPWRCNESGTAISREGSGQFDPRI